MHHNSNQIMFGMERSYYTMDQCHNLETNPIKTVPWQRQMLNLGEALTVSRPPSFFRIIILVLSVNCACVVFVLNHPIENCQLT